MQRLCYDGSSYDKFMFVLRTALPDLLAFTIGNM
jgi:hypothetical protein